MATKKTDTPSKITKAAKAPNLSIFNLNVPQELLAQAVYVYQSNSHQSTSKVKSRGEVQASTKKIYRQKGTGNARHGALSAPIFVGGGIAHGPVAVRARAKRLNKKVKLLALAGSLSLLNKDNKLSLLSLPASKVLKTKKLIASLGQDTNTTITLVHHQDSPELLKASANIKAVNSIRADQLNAFQVLQSPQLILTSNAYTYLADKLASVLNKKKTTVTNQSKAK